MPFQASNSSETPTAPAALLGSESIDLLRISEARPRLRIGIVVDAEIPSTGLEEIVRAIRSCRNLELVGVVRAAMEGKNRKPSDPLLFKLWRKLNSSNSRSASQRRCRINDCRMDQRMDQLDFVIHIGDGTVNESVPAYSRYGTCRIPNPFSETADAAWFWAMYRNNSVFETRLQGGPAAESKLMAEAFAAVDRFFLSRNRTAKIRKTCELLARSLPQLALQASPGFHEFSIDPHARIKPVPRNLDVATFFFHYIVDGIPRALRNRLFEDHWFIAFRQNPGAAPTSVGEMSSFQIVSPPKDRFYADPFLIRRGERDFLFFEDYPFDFGKGVISFIELDQNGNCTPPEVALERPYHLSYPCVFEHEGEVYMVPESLATRAVEVYRALDFPRCWKLEKVLLQDVCAVDPTILWHDGKFWLFVSGVSSRHCLNEDLHLFYADSLFGTWHAHEKNPIVSDVRRARPAGRLFYRDGQLIRPAQDCSPRYGRAVCFNRVEELSPSSYRETPLAVIGPEWSRWNRGTHTFNQTETLQVVDGRVLIPRLRFRFPAAPGAVRLAPADRDCPQVGAAPCPSTE